MAKPQQGVREAGKAASKNKKFKKRERKNVPYGLVHIQATFNNTIVTITDRQGNTLSWKSSGSLGFRGSRKGTPFAAQQAAINAANAARDHGLRSVDVRVSGSGFGPRIGSPRAGSGRARSALHSRRYADPAQRLPSAEAAQSITAEPAIPEPSGRNNWQRYNRDGPGRRVSHL